MKLLIFTQKVDKNDPVLGFFHGWLVAFSKEVESITVICLGKGEVDLPNNVSVYSLGKETKVSKLGYLVNLYKYLFLIRGTYDRVFVHMNQEYVILGGLYWKLAGIPVYMWRNHPAGNTFTRLAVMFSKKTFCTSTDSYIARFKKNMIMPAGIDTTVFKSTQDILRKKYSVCVVGRISPIKNVHIAIEAVNILVKSGTQVSMTIVGSSLERDKKYDESVRKYVLDNNLSTSIFFTGPVAPSDLPNIYCEHEVCLNLTDSGSFDKTIVEAAACGAVPLVSNSSLRPLLPEGCVIERNPEAVASAIERVFNAHERVELQDKLKIFVENQSLLNLTKKLFTEIK